MKLVLLLVLCQFVEYKPVKSSPQRYPTLTDVEAHIDPKHGQYYRDNDFVTWAHETTHGINSDIRMRFGKGKRIQGLYCLNDLAMIIEEPGMRLSHVAQHVPNSLRFNLFNSYLLNREWDDTPTYVLDEWVAYTNGSVCWHEVPKSNRFGSVSGMFQFNIYAIALCKAVKAHRPDYDDTNLKNFVVWNIKRSYSYKNGEESEILKAWKTSPDAQPLRDFAKSYFGEDFYREVLLD